MPAAPAHSTSPTVRPAQPEGLNSALARNIEALESRRRDDEENAPRQEKIAAVVTAFTGSMTFVYVHLAVLVFWVAANVGVVPGIPRFDESFVLLATSASVEAIFLSTFVLISQNRAATAAERRAALDLQINLLSEHEITRLIHLVSGIAQKLGVEGGDHPEIGELGRDVAPEAILDTLEKTADPRT